MPSKNHDLHGSAPDTSSVALLLIDVINDLAFDEGHRLLTHARAMAGNIARLRARCDDVRIPSIYVNDNFGRWQSNFTKQVEHCLSDGVPGRPIVELLRPREQDYFVLKPKHSGFYSTTLDVLLHYLEVETLILVGMAGNICVLFTANDAHMRDYRLVIPRDCIASNDVQENEHALRQMELILKADTTSSPELDLNALIAAP